MIGQAWLLIFLVGYYQAKPTQVELHGQFQALNHTPRPYERTFCA